MSDTDTIQERIAALRPWPEGERVIRALERLAGMTQPNASEPLRPWDWRESPVAGESSREATAQRKRNRQRRDQWDRWADARCAVCGRIRFHVSHEMDPEHSPEGAEYHAGFAHHTFESETLREAAQTVLDVERPICLTPSDAAVIVKALTIGRISHDGDSWYAADAGYDYDHAEATLNAASAILRMWAARLPEEPR